ncbi:MAG: DNA-directed RNA polymerase subunit beta [Patescibacteria group bacterium]
MPKVKNFGRRKNTLELPYLLDLQKESWDLFWEERLENLFKEASPIKDYSGKEWEIYFSDYKLEESKYENAHEAKENNDSYTAPLKVEVELVNLETEDTKKQEIFLCDFPLMSRRGTFIVNGVERVAVSQLIRSPGAFFTSDEKKGEQVFGAKIIPNRGTWLEFVSEPDGFIGVRIDRRRKVPVTTLLRALGVGEKKMEKGTDAEIKEIFNEIDKSDISYIKRTLERDPSKNRKEAVMEIYRRMRPGEAVTADPAKELIENTFFNFDRYDLSEVGRWRMWQRLPELKLEEDRDITTEDRTLKTEDVIAVIKEIIRLNNDPEATEDKIDHLGNRRVRAFTELLENNLRKALMRIDRNVKDKISTAEDDNLDPSKLINARPFASEVQKFFSSSAISQFMDQENPLAELEHKRRLTATGPGGLTRERAGFEARDVQSSHYGRICPIQTPEGSNVGLVNHFALFSRVNRYGFVETPYYKVKNGKVTKEVEYLDAHEEEQYKIAHGGVEIEDGEIVPERVEARVEGEPGMVDKDEIDYIDVSAEQLISVAASTIPFLQNDDANRALMGANMQRQAVPLLKPAVPHVGTGMEKKVAKDSGHAVLAKADGEVVAVDGKKIIIEDKDGKKYEHELETFSHTNNYTCFHQKPTVDKGEKVEQGDIISDGGSIVDGRLALGQNPLIAFLPWRGYNYEDAIVVSERLVKDDIYTSIHIENFTCDVRETKLGPEVTTNDIPNVSEEKLKHLDDEGIIRIGAEVGPGDILVGKISPKGKSELTPEERLLKAIFGEKAKDVKDSSLRMKHGKKGRVVGIKVFSREQGHKLDTGVIKKVEVRVAQMRKIKTGDKLSGRHGNKGVISTVLPEEEMPFLEDGTPVDVVLNPLGVISRMNIGQIMETHLGLAAKELGYLAETPSLSGATNEDIKEELRKAGLPESGQLPLYDGRTGEKFPRKVTVGYMYMLKLIHMIEDKLHMRAIGPYSLITQQPLGGKAQFGGQRFGEMEVWALQGYGAAHTLQEMLTIKSDDVPGRAAAYEAILKGEEIKKPNLPASFQLLLSEMKAIGLNIQIKEEK